MAYAEVNGIKLYYEIKGNPDSDKTVVFLNGVMASVSSWVLQIPVFEKMGYRIILHDFKGQLLSEKPSGVYTFSEHAAETKSLLEQVGVKKAHFIGTSYGGEVGMQFAVDYPEMVRTLSIIDSVSELDETLKLFVRGWKELAADKDPDKFFWGMAPSIYSNAFLENSLSLLEDRAKLLSQVPKEYFDGQISLYDTFLKINITKDLKKIKAPALVVCGEEDILKPVKFSKLIAENIPNSELAVIPNCGHVTIFEKPHVLNSMLLGFVLKHS
jgi:3-oxoadipate enol-lactonase